MCRFLSYLPYIMGLEKGGFEKIQIIFYKVNVTYTFDMYNEAKQINCDTKNHKKHHINLL